MTHLGLSPVFLQGPVAVMACGDPGRLMRAGLRGGRRAKGLGRKKGSPRLKYVHERSEDKYWDDLSKQNQVLVTYINRIG